MRKFYKQIVIGSLILLFGFLLAAIILIIFLDRNIKPEFIQVTNLTDTGATIVWYTEEKTISRVYIQEKTDNSSWSDLPVISQMGKTLFYDDRDVEQNTDPDAKPDEFWIQKESGLESRHTHHVTLRGLKPETEYNIRIGGVIKTIDTDKNGNPLRTITTQAIIDDIKTPDPAYGKVDGIDSAVTDTIVFAYLTEKDNKENILTNLFSTTLSDKSSYSIDVNLLKAQAEKEGEDSQSLYIQILTSKGKRNYSLFNLEFYKPLDTIVIDETQISSNSLYESIASNVQASNCSEYDSGCTCPTNSNITGCLTQSGWNTFISDYGGNCASLKASESGFNLLSWQESCPSPFSDDNVDGDNEDEESETRDTTRTKPTDTENLEGIGEEEKPDLLDIGGTIGEETGYIVQEIATEAETEVSGVTNEDLIETGNVKAVNEGTTNCDQGPGGEIYFYCQSCPSNSQCIFRDFLISQPSDKQSCTEVCKIVRGEEEGVYVSGITGNGLMGAAPGSAPSTQTEFVGVYSTYDEMYVAASEEFYNTYGYYADMSLEIIDCNTAPYKGGYTCELLGEKLWCLADTNSTENKMYCNKSAVNFDLTPDIIFHELGHAHTSIGIDAMETNLVDEHCKQPDDSCDETCEACIDNMRYCLNVTSEVAAEDVSNGGGKYQFYFRGILYHGSNTEGLFTAIANSTGFSYEQVQQAFYGQNAQVFYEINRQVGLCGQNPSMFFGQIIPNQQKDWKVIPSVNAQIEGELSSPVTLDNADFTEELAIVSDKAPTELDAGRYSLTSDTYDVTRDELVIRESGEKAKIIYFNDLNQDGIKQDDEPAVDPPTLLAINKESEAFTYNLTQGWNLVSFPFLMEDATYASELLEEINETGIDAISIAYFDGSNFPTYIDRSDDNQYSNDFPIIPGRGYFVKVLTTPGQVTLTGNAYAESVPIQISNGWNLIGVTAPDTEYTADSFLDACIAQDFQATMMSQYESGLYETVVKEDDLLYGNDFNITSKNGYFLRVDSGGGDNEEMTP